MAGGYDNEDRQAEMEELRQAREREAREELERLREAAREREGKDGKGPAAATTAPAGAEEPGEGPLEPSKKASSRQGQGLPGQRPKGI